MNNKKIKMLTSILFFSLLMFTLINVVKKDEKAVASATNQISYTEMLKKIEDGTITSVKINPENQNALGMTSEGSLYSTNVLPNDTALLDAAKAKNADMEISPKASSSSLGSFLLSFGPVILLIGFFVWMMKKQKGGGGVMNFGKSKAQMIDPAKNNTRLADVAGCEEAKLEVTEIVDFLKDPRKYSELGAKIPRGILMSGGPGTGKTLLARAIAGEAAVPFMSVSGSDFVEMFVGVGASRIRSMFEEAKKNAPAIIFIDEIDAVGRQRSGSAGGGGHEEREQTLNQLLVEMDGFEETSGVIVIAATNRPDILDSALRRPGRFDREVVIGLPDVQGREKILGVHAKKVKLASSVDLNEIARGTIGFSGAELANLVNEAALMAARRNKTVIDRKDFSEALDKINMGVKRENAIVPLESKEVTAYHEAGHAIVAHFIPEADPLHKVTIVPRGRAAGVTMQLPVKERQGYDKEELLANIAVLLAGRLAEEMFLRKMTTGASNDIERATSIAENMVTKWGMSSMGMVHFGANSGTGFRGDNGGGGHAISAATHSRVEQEIEGILKSQYERVKNLLAQKKEEMILLAEGLLERETLDIEEIEYLFSNGSLPEIKIVKKEVEVSHDNLDDDAEKSSPSIKKGKRMIDLFEPNWGGATASVEPKSE